MLRQLCASDIGRMTLQHLSLPNAQPSAPNASFESAHCPYTISELVCLANGQFAPQLETR
ncbi:MAG: hypothetical protein Q7U19_06955 [Methylotenera sp.]|nr:hypothetical protein [Methylotenera sp.]